MGNLKSKIEALRPALADAAQQVVDSWEQDEYGMDEMLGSGGVCDQVAMSLIDIIQSNLDVDAVCGAPEGEDHEWVVVSDGQEACVVDIPPGVYEIGGGYSWTKIEGAEVGPGDVLVEEIPREDVADLFDENYAQDFLFNMSSDGMTDDLWQLAKDDAKTLKNLEIDSDKERNLYFYLDHFYEDLCEEFGCQQPEARGDVLSMAFQALRKKEKVDLTDIRRAVYSAIRSVSPTHKVAYPNVHMDDIRLPSYDVGEWVDTLNSIYAAVHQGYTLSAATEKFTEGWSPMAKEKFEAWKRFYDKADHKKYAGMYRVAFPFTEKEQPSFDLSTMPEMPQEEVPAVRKPGRPRKKIKTPEDIKRSLISRLDSADKLLREFTGVWPTNVWNRLHSSLNDLKREVMMLRSASTMRDVIVKTAGVWSNEGFQEGAELLEKIAQPPEEGDVASEIEQALTGERPEKPKEEPAAAEMEMSPEELDAMPPGEAGDELPMPEPPLGEETPAEVPEELEEPQEDLEVEEEPAKADVEENPYVGSSIGDVVEVLEPVVLELKERAVARELAKVDMMLDAQNIASHFPELGEAMNKVLESNTYVVTRLDKLLTKIKGGAQEKEKDEEKPETTGPEIDMAELTAPEETDLEVSEETAAAPIVEPQAPADLEVAEEPVVPPAADDFRG